MAVPDQAQRLPSDPTHPDYGLFRQLLAGVGRLQRWDESGSRNIAAALYAEVRHNPQMHKVDEVVLGDPGAATPSVFAVYRNRTINQIMRAHAPLSAADLPAETALQAFALPPSCMARNGFMLDPSVRAQPLPALEQGPLEGPNALVIGRLDAADVTAAVEHLGNPAANRERQGAHFLVDREGHIHQLASLHESTRHIAPADIPARSPLQGSGLGLHGLGAPLPIAGGYPAFYPTAGDSIGIQILATRDPAGGQWQEPSPQQLASVSRLVGTLKAEFGLDDNDLYRHIPIQLPQGSPAAGISEPKPAR